MAAPSARAFCFATAASSRPRNSSASPALSANDPRLHFGLGSATTADAEIH
ncbi:MAG: ASPIC/UnbV domain-containing protein [Acidobacteriaceae bacterium]